MNQVSKPMPFSELFRFINMHLSVLVEKSKLSIEQYDSIPSSTFHMMASLLLSGKIKPKFISIIEGKKSFHNTLTNQYLDELLALETVDELEENLSDFYYNFHQVLLQKAINLQYTIRMSEENIKLDGDISSLFSINELCDELNRFANEFTVLCDIHLFSLLDTKFNMHISLAQNPITLIWKQNNVWVAGHKALLISEDIDKFFATNCVF